jgi:hypothetical protein
MPDDDDSSSAAPETGTDAITAALVNGFRSKSVDVDDDGVAVIPADGLYHLAVRLSKRATPLPAVSRRSQRVGARQPQQGSIVRVPAALSPRPLPFSAGSAHNVSHIFREPRSSPTTAACSFTRRKAADENRTLFHAPPCSTMNL